MRVFALLAVLSIAGAVRAQQSPAAAKGQSLTSGARVDSLFAFATDSTPGCAMAAARDGSVLYKAGYGLADLENRVRITPQTTFYMGSTSKQFTAAAINLLVLDGRLSLDDDVRKYVPEVPNYGPTITIGHLLHHTSGLRDYFALFGLAGLDDYPITNADFLAMIARQRALNFPPGDQISYSNTGYVLLSLVVERASGMPLRTFAHERIFGPLGMTSTQFRDRHTALIPRRASAYDRSPTGYTLSVPYFDLVGDGGLFSSVEDVARWEANFWTPRVGGDDWLRMTARHGRLANGTELGYGAGLVFGTYRNEGIVEHGGAMGGYNLHILRFPRQRFSAVVLCNSFAVSASVLARHIADIYLGDSLAAARVASVTQAAHPTVPSTPTGPTNAPSSSSELGRYTGTYFSDAVMLVRRIVVDSGHLRWVLGPGNASELVPTGTRTFAMMGTSQSVVFSKDADSIRVERPGFPAIAFVRTVPAAGTDLNLYAGTYVSPELRTTWTFAVSGSTLLLHPERGDTVRYMPVFTDAFEGSGVLAQFQRDARGMIIAADVSAGERARRIRFTRQVR